MRAHEIDYAIYGEEMQYVAGNGYCRVGQFHDDGQRN